VAQQTGHQQGSQGQHLRGDDGMPTQQLRGERRGVKEVSDVLAPGMIRRGRDPKTQRTSPSRIRSII
jgi:hypothetical protein